MKWDRGRTSRGRVAKSFPNRERERERKRRQRAMRTSEQKEEDNRRRRERRADRTAKQVEEDNRKQREDQASRRADRTAQQVEEDNRKQREDQALRRADRTAQQAEEDNQRQREDKASRRAARTAQQVEEDNRKTRRRRTERTPEQIKWEKRYHRHYWATKGKYRRQYRRQDTREYVKNVIVPDLAEHFGEEETQMYGEDEVVNALGDLAICSDGSDSDPSDDDGSVRELGAFSWDDQIPLCRANKYAVTESECGSSSEEDDSESEDSDEDDGEMSASLGGSVQSRLGASFDEHSDDDDPEDDGDGDEPGDDDSEGDESTDDEAGDECEVESDDDCEDESPEAKCDLLLREDTFCHNCKRTEVSDALPRYQLGLQKVPGGHLSSMMMLSPELRELAPIDHCFLCKHCYVYASKVDPLVDADEKKKLQKRRRTWEVTWPTFFRDMLIGKDRIGLRQHFYEEYTDGYLWRFVPNSLREFWLPWMVKYRDKEGRQPYAQCTIESPPSFFKDRTLSFETFQEHINSYDLGRWKKALLADDSDRVLLPNVLCPWGCTEFCHQASRFNAAYLIQHHLPKVQLNFPDSSWYNRLHLYESSRLDYLRPKMNYSSVLMNEEWPIRPTVLVDPEGVLWVCHCRNHRTFQSMKHLHFHLPKKPGHNLSPEEPDQLCPVVVNPQTLRKTKPSAYSTSFRMQSLNTNFQGISSAKVSLDGGNFTAQRRAMLTECEGLSLRCRGDIKSLGERLIEKGSVQDSYLRGTVKRSERLHSEEDLEDARHGATYITMEDNLDLQQLSSESGKIHVYKEDEEMIVCSRTWAPRIMYMRTEDSSGYGYRMKALGAYKQRRRSTPGDPPRPYMMTWSLCGATLACPELWKALDCRSGSFSHNWWDGYFLAHLTTKYLHHIEVKTPRSQTPFVGKSISTTDGLMDKLELCLPRQRPQRHEDNPDSDEKYFKFNVDCWRRLFPEEKYPGVGVYLASGRSARPGNNVTVSNKDVLIGVSYNSSSGGRNAVLPERGECDVVINGHAFELRVILCTFTPKEGYRKSCSDFEGRRYMRVGGGHSNWRRQIRTNGNEGKALVTDMDPSKDPFSEMEGKMYSKLLFGCVVIYVRKANRDDTDLAKARIEFHRQIGGQGEVYCKCCNYPLIATGRLKEHRRPCMHEGCKKVETFVCKSAKCHTRLCSSCVKSLPAGEITKVEPPKDEEARVQIGVDVDAPVEEYAVGPTPATNDNVLSKDDDGQSLDSENLGPRSDDQSDASDDEGLMTNVADVRLDSGQFLTSAGMTDEHMYRYEEDDKQQEAPAPMCIPATNAGEARIDVLPTDRTKELGRIPSYVLFNQGGCMGDRRNQKLSGTLAQRNFVQRLVASVDGESVPLLYLFGMLMPRHFYSAAQHHPSAILGAPPLCCYSSRTHSYGIASNLQHSRLQITNADSSASTDSHLAFLHYDVQCNGALSEMDSRLIHRHGFVVDPMNKHGISLRQCTNELEEGVDSHQAAMNLAGAQPYLEWDIFATFTLNHKDNPSTKALHAWKTQRKWTESIPGYIDMADDDREEYKIAFEQAYGGVVARCWFEAKKLWLEYLSYGKSVAGERPQNVFWRDEYQESSGNLSHIHGLIGMRKEDMANEEFRKKVMDLQRNSVLDLIPASEVGGMIERGLLDDVEDWHEVKSLASRVLRHTCNGRCKIRKGVGEGRENFVCKKTDVNRDSVDHNAHEFMRLKYGYCPETKKMLDEVGIDWTVMPVVGTGVGEFFDRVDNEPVNLLNPTKHIGKIHRGEDDNLSPAVADWFAVWRSQMNYQILHGTNGAARYVVKYVVKMDAGNRCTVYADAHNPSKMKVENQFLHNTKIVTSKINEDKAHEKSRKRKLPNGRSVGYVEVCQHILGLPEVMTNLQFKQICSKPAEERPKCRIKLDSKGNLRRPDKQRTVSDRMRLGLPVDSARSSLPKERQATPNQLLLYQGDVSEVTSYDEVAQFGLRPVELMQLFANVPEYFRWFKIEKKALAQDEIEKLIDEDVTKCAWITCLGQRVRLRRRAYAEVQERFRTKFANGDNLEKHSRQLLWFLKRMMKADEVNDLFVYDDQKETKDLPIPVLSAVKPHRSIPFLLHTMIVCGDFPTELDLVQCKDLKQCLVNANLIKEDMDEKAAMRELIVECCIKKVFPRIPLSLRRIEDYLLTAHRLFKQILTGGDLPLTGLPPCILTEILDDKEKELGKFWEDSREKHLASIYNTLPEQLPLPTKESVLQCTRHRHAKWEKGRKESFQQLVDQCDESYREQMHAVTTGVRALEKYGTEFGNTALTITKGMIIHGVPGAGKSHVISYLSLVALSMGLRLMTTALLGVRANAFGGIHLHKLLCLPVRKRVNPGRMAELCRAVLEHRKSNAHLLHCLLTMDVLVIDEFGMLSAEQLTVLDLLLRRLRSTSLPFGGVLILGTMDHAQFSAIEGAPILTSHYFLSDFVLVGLERSVRARGDKNLQEIQNITRMNPNKLIEDPELKKRFIELMLKTLSFAKNWNSDQIDAKTVRMFSKRRQAKDSSMEVCERVKSDLERGSTPHVTCESRDSCVLEKTRQQHSPVDRLPKGIREKVKGQMNRQLSEPSCLLFHEGAQFMATVNSAETKKEPGYNQSQTLYMLDLPPRELINTWSPIKLWACGKSGVSPEDLQRDGKPDRASLSRLGWKEVTVKCAPDHSMITVDGYQCVRKQYTLAHIGSSTINKQTGNTIRGKTAIEVSEDCAPFDKPSTVVGLSRNESGKDIIIVCGPNVKGSSQGDPSPSEKKAAINRLWKAMTKKTQWTDYIDDILSRLSTNGNSGNSGNSNNRPTPTIAYDNYPFQTSNIGVPSSKTGYIYLLVSLRDINEIYVGETECLSTRLTQHNSGFGSKGTAPAALRPWGLAGYICGLGHMHKRPGERMQLERNWKNFNWAYKIRGGTLQDMIDNGERTATKYNHERQDLDCRIRFVQTMTRKAVAEESPDVRRL